MDASLDDVNQGSILLSQAGAVGRGSPPAVLGRPIEMFLDDIPDYETCVLADCQGQPQTELVRLAPWHVLAIPFGEAHEHG